MEKMTVLVASTNPIMRRLLRDLVASAEDLRLVAAVEDASSLLPRAKKSSPDIALLDLTEGFSLSHVRQLRLVSAASVVCISAQTQPGALESSAAYQAGAAHVLGMPSGNVSLDLIPAAGEIILDALRKAAERK
jgi:chemotaxis response regulator CheB